MNPDVASAIQAAIRRSLEMDAPLADRLAAYVAASRTLNPAFIAPVEALVTRLRQNGAAAGAPDVGEAMPPFALPDAAGRIVWVVGWRQCLEVGVSVAPRHTTNGTPARQ